MSKFSTSFEKSIALDDNTLSQVFSPEFIPVIGIKFLLFLKHGDGSLILTIPPATPPVKARGADYFSSRPEIKGE
jgi:hypothetical protein